MKFGNQTRITTEQKRNSEEGGGRTVDSPSPAAMMRV